jgi:preprotein translocase subunit SecA
MVRQPKSSCLAVIDRLLDRPVRHDLSHYWALANQIEAINLEATSNTELLERSQTLQSAARAGTPLDELAVEAFALVRSATIRTLGIHPHTEQLIAGLGLHQGAVAEMATGEGKTLAAVSPAFLNALTGEGVHIHTFNDYLARRDAGWMGPIYRLLGLDVGCIQDGMSVAERQQAYARDVTYATVKEAGFDLLRDSLCYEPSDQVHRPFHFALVDEADSILIDEARIPLVIAGATDEAPERFDQLSKLARSLHESRDFVTDEGRRNIALTEEGLVRVESALGGHDLHAGERLDLLTRLHLALHAEHLITRDVDYIVRNGVIEIVDELTGRVVDDRQWPDGLHAAVEAKEQLTSGSRGRILGQITIQHFLALYPKLAGMTATARPAAEELRTTYGLDTVLIPPHTPCRRIDLPDHVFTHREAKWRALTEEIVRAHTSSQPVLVGTASVQESEELASLLDARGILCSVLNARHDEYEAEIVAQAGVPGAVTISTNMAGRGTDIKLGGSDQRYRAEVLASGGLLVLGTNRHESRRIDLQLRGRAGRQGDPGSSRFFISLEDDLFKRYQLEDLLPARVRATRSDQPISSPLVNGEIDRAQRIVEGQCTSIRTTLSQYSEVVEQQRTIIAARRQRVLEGCWDSLLDTAEPEALSRAREVLGMDTLRELERRLTLRAIDAAWADHLALIAELREGIHLQEIGGKSPLVELHRGIVDPFDDISDRVASRVATELSELDLDDTAASLQQIRGPSSTWTYLVNDTVFGSWIGLLGGRNVGLLATAAAFYAPLLLLLAVARRWFKRDS